MLKDKFIVAKKDRFDRHFLLRYFELKAVVESCQKFSSCFEKCMLLTYFHNLYFVIPHSQIGSLIFIFVFTMSSGLINIDKVKGLPLVYLYTCIVHSYSYPDLCLLCAIQSLISSVAYHLHCNIVMYVHAIF